MRVVLCNCPPEHASKIARTLVEERLAACVNVAPGVFSFYVWEGKVCEEPETTLIIKTSDERWDDLHNRIVELHPYSVPEIIAIDVAAASPAYLKWVEENSR
jgi:periplasmic divalent cation tolerance protein